MYRLEYKVKKIELEEKTSFECLRVHLSINGILFNCINVYRPPPSEENEFTVNMFLTEFEEFMDSEHFMNEKLLLLGDFNFHAEKDNRFSPLLE